MRPFNAPKKCHYVAPCAQNANNVNDNADRHTTRVQQKKKTNLNADWRPAYDPKVKLIFLHRIPCNVLLLSIHEPQYTSAK